MWGAQEFPLTWLISYLHYCFAKSPPTTHGRGNVLFVKQCTLGAVHTSLVKYQGRGDTAWCGTYVSKRSTTVFIYLPVKGPFLLLFLAKIHQAWQAGPYEPSWGQSSRSLAQCSPPLFVKSSRQPSLDPGFVESCEMMYTESQERWGWRCRGLHKAGGVEARISRSLQSSTEQNQRVLVLYKVMSSEGVGVGRVHRFILIHCLSCQWGEEWRASQLIAGPLLHKIGLCIQTYNRQKTLKRGKFQSKIDF